MLRINPFDVRCSNMPKKYYTKIFDNIIKQHGIVQATLIVLRDFGLMQAFDWKSSKEGFDFWFDALEEARKIKKDAESTLENNAPNQSMIDVMVQSAVERGFAIHKWTRVGQIIDKSPVDGEIYGHEILRNGDFFFHNIKVYKNGEWLEPLDEMPVEYEDEQNEKRKVIDGLLSLVSKIEKLEDLKKDIEKIKNKQGVKEEFVERNPDVKHPFNGFDVHLN